MYETSIKVAKTYKRVHVFHAFRCAPIFNGFNFDWVHLNTIFANYQAQILGLGDMKLAFIDVGLYVKFTKFG